VDGTDVRAMVPGVLDRRAEVLVRRSHGSCNFNEAALLSDAALGYDEDRKVFHLRA
jgi:hypothetical protein